eukprot:scaffold353_cov66-Phaeocystis_antarctica.AAC.3
MTLWSVIFCSHFLPGLVCSSWWSVRSEGCSTSTPVLKYLKSSVHGTPAMGPLNSCASKGSRLWRSSRSTSSRAIRGWRTGSIAQTKSF